MIELGDFIEIENGLRGRVMRIEGGKVTLEAENGLQTTCWLSEVVRVYDWEG